MDGYHRKKLIIGADFLIAMPALDMMFLMPWIFDKGIFVWTLLQWITIENGQWTNICFLFAPGLFSLKLRLFVLAAHREGCLSFCYYKLNYYNIY